MYSKTNFCYSVVFNLVRIVCAEKVQKDILHSGTGILIRGWRRPQGTLQIQQRYRRVVFLDCLVVSEN